MNGLTAFTKGTPENSVIPSVKEMVLSMNKEVGSQQTLTLLTP